MAFTMDHPTPGQTSVSPNPVPATPQYMQEITYTPFSKAKLVSEDGYKLFFDYGPDNERVKSTFSNPAYVIDTKYFIGNYEKQITRH